MNRRGIRDYTGEFRYRVRPRESWIRTIDTKFTGRVVTDREANRFESSAFKLTPVQFGSDAGDELEFAVFLEKEDIDQAFELTGDTLILPGRYDWEQVGVRLDTADSRIFRLIFDWRWGGFYDGRITRTDTTIELRPSPHFFFALRYLQNTGRLDRRVDGSGNVFKGDFTQRLVRMDVNVNFTPDLSWTNLIQYDNTTDTMSLNSRLRWEISYSW